MGTFKKILYFLVALALLSGCSTKHPTVVLKVIETTDVHGSIFPYDFLNAKPIKHSLAQISYYIKEQRKNPNQYVVLLDNGDVLQGNPDVYYYNYVDTTDTNLVVRVMNYLNYDAGTVGNHDIEPGHKIFDKVRAELHFPWLSANSVSTKTGKPYFKPYTVINKGGIKICVLGLTTPGIPDWVAPDKYKGIKFEDMVKTARKWIKIIKQKEHPDLIIGLFHAGHDYTYGGEDSTMCCNQNATLLVAKYVPGFDLILCGHDHDVFMDTVVNVAGDSVPVIDPGSHSLYIGVATITMKWNNKLHKYTKHIVPQIISTDTIPVDPAFMKKFAADLNKVKKYVSDTVGYLTHPLDGRKVYFGDSKFMDFIHTVQLNVSHAQISFAAPLRFDAYLDSGYVTVADMFKLYKYSNTLYTMRLKGSEILKYLEFSADHWFNTMKSPSDHMLLFQNGTHRFKYRYYNFDSGEGIKYTVDLTKPDGHKVKIISLQNGKPFDTSKYYTVAVNSYRGNGGGGLLTKGAGIPHDSLKYRIIRSTNKDIRFYIMKYFETHHKVTPTVDNNWHLVPVSWAKQAEKRDWQFLFGNKK